MSEGDRLRWMAAVAAALCFVLKLLAGGLVGVLALLGCLTALALWVAQPYLESPERRRELLAELAPRWAELKRTAHHFRRNPLALLGLVIVTLIILMALAAPLLAPPEPGQRDVTQMEEHFEYNYDLQAPGENGYKLGSTDKGYDVYYGIVWGSRVSLKVALIVVGCGTLISTVLGVVSGYYGGRVDEIVMRITDVFLAIPGLILALAIAAVLGNSITYVMYALIIVWWPGYTRIIRAQALSIRQMPYVEAARAAGASDARILFRHMLPNCLSPVVITATMDMGGVVLTLAALGFLGFGGGPALAEWGKLVGYGQNHLTDDAWWAFFFPGLAIGLWALGFYLLGDGLRDILDPRQRQ